MAGQNQEPCIREGLDKSRITRDEEDIQNMRSTINCISNQFSEEESPLLELSCSVVAETAVAPKLKKA